MKMKKRLLCITLLLVMIIGTIPISAKDKKATKWVYDTTGILTENEDVNRQIQDIVDRLELEIDNKVSGGKNIDRYFIVYLYDFIKDGSVNSASGTKRAIELIPDNEYPKNYKKDNYIQFYIQLSKSFLDDIEISFIYCSYSFEGNANSNITPISIQKDGNVLYSIDYHYGIPLYEVFNMTFTYKELQKKQSSNKGKLYVGEYGILDEYSLYLNNLKITDKTTIGDIIKNTKYNIYISPEPLKKIKNIYSSDLYENALLYLSGDKVQINTRKEEYIENYYPLKVYSPDDNFYELGNMYFNFTSQYGRSTNTLTNANDYYIKKVLSIKNAPKLKSFKKDFMKKVSGEGKDDIVITKLTNGIGYSVQIPMCNTKNGIIYPNEKLIITYHYNSNGKCIKTTWQRSGDNRENPNMQSISDYRYYFK